MQGAQQIKQIIGENIRARREALDISRMVLATKIGADPLQVYRWEAGRHRPTDQRLALIAHELDCDVVWLVTDHKPRRSA